MNIPRLWIYYKVDCGIYTDYRKTRIPKYPDQESLQSRHYHRVLRAIESNPLYTEVDQEEYDSVMACVEIPVYLSIDDWRRAEADSEGEAPPTNINF